MYASKYNLVFDLEDRADAIVINPLAGSMDAVRKTEKDLLATLRGHLAPTSLGLEEIGYLVARGYLYPSPAYEEALLRELVAKDDREDFPSDFLLFPTFLCNFRCVYCFQQGSANPPGGGIISHQHVRQAFAAIDRICGQKKQQTSPLLYVFGGEPLLRAKRAEAIVQDVLGQARERGFRIGIITNGWNLSHYSQTLRDHGVDLVQVTLDGTPAVHDMRRKLRGGAGTFDGIVRGIADLLDSDIQLYIRINLDAQNLDTLPEFAEFAHASGWDRDNVVVFVGPYRDLLCRDYQYQLPEPVMLERVFWFHRHCPQTRIIRLLEWPGVDFILSYLRDGKLPPPRLSYCISSYGRFGFDPDGWVYACGTAAGDPHHAIGRYYPELDLDAEQEHIWRRRRFVDIPRCRECPAAPLCGGGCALQSRIKYDGARPFCPELVANMSVVLNHYYERIVGE